MSTIPEAKDNPENAKIKDVDTPYEISNVNPKNLAFLKNFTIHPGEVKVTRKVAIRKVPVVVKNNARVQLPTFEEHKQHKMNESLTYSKFIFPCYLFLTENQSIHTLLDKTDEFDPSNDPVPKLEYLFPSLSAPIRSLFRHSQTQPTKIDFDERYFWWTQSCANLDNYQVLKLTSQLHCCVKAKFSYSKTFMNCVNLISPISGALDYFTLFLDTLCEDVQSISTIPLSRTRGTHKKSFAQMRQKKNPHTFGSKLYTVKPTATRSQLFQSSITHISHELDDCSKPPVLKKLPSFQPRVIPSEKDPHVTKSYIRQETILQNHLADALLFNSQYVSLFSGSEGGSNNNECGKDEQLISDQEKYFHATHYIPDAQVIVNRIEKSILFLNQEIEFSPNYLFPGFLIGAIKDVYGSENAYRIFQALKEDRSQMKDILLPRLYESRDAYYKQEFLWEEFHAY